MNYSVKFINNSINFGNVCIYQTDPTLDTKVMSLAWLTKSSYPTTNVEFNWTLDYNFVWAETGQLSPGVLFKASQTWPANLKDLNTVNFSYENGAYTFKNLGNGNEGELHIVEEDSLPINTTSVGIGMSGYGTFVKPAQPNMNMMFSPTPNYWITFGDFEHGEVLDITKITNKAKIYFPPNVYSLTVILGKDNSWSIIPN